MSDVGSYQYKPLTNPGAFRIILLQSSPDVTSPIICNLIHTTIAHYDNSIISHYTALSYVWGDATQRSEIYVDGKRLSVTASLDLALRHVRDFEHEMYVWADGICIDQSSVEEKTVQVRMMGRIYSVARHTIIHLGDATGESEDLFSMVSAHEIQEELVDEMMTLLKPLVDRPWFYRVWILQELVLSVDPWVQCGTGRLRWNKLIRLLQYRKTDFDILYDMHYIRQRYIRESAGFPSWGHTTKGLRTLLETMHRRRGCGVFDPRDMLFAHLGMIPQKASHDFDSLVAVNYSKSVTEVYKDLALYTVRTWSNLEILSYVVEHSLEDEKDVDLPSWVPDWSVKQLDDVKDVTFVESDNIDNLYQRGYMYLGITGVLVTLGLPTGVITSIRDSPSSSELASFMEDLPAVFVETIYRDPQVKVRLSKEQKDAERAAWEKHTALWFGSDYVAGLSSNDHTSQSPNTTRRSLHILEGINKRQPKNPGITRKIALLDGSRLLLVPETARTGDVVWELAADKLSFFVLRPFTSAQYAGEVDPIINAVATEKAIAKERYVIYTSDGYLLWGREHEMFVSKLMEEVPNYDSWKKETYRSPRINWQFLQKHKVYEDIRSENSMLAGNEALRKAMDELCDVVFGSQSFAIPEDEHLCRADLTSVGHFRFAGMFQGASQIGSYHPPTRDTLKIIALH